jgi:hypothetical protein
VDAIQLFVERLREMLGKEKRLFEIKNGYRFTGVTIR